MFRNGINYLVSNKTYSFELFFILSSFSVWSLFYTNNRYNPEAQLDLKDHELLRVIRETRFFLCVLIYFSITNRFPSTVNRT
jgi:hypothetical protein